MSFVDKILEFVRGTIPARNGKEASHMVPKAAVVSMFHDGHQLYTVVAEIFDTWKHIISEICVTGHFSFGRRNSNMTFVDSKALWLCGAIVAPLVSPVWGVPVKGPVIHADGLVLDGVLGPGGHPPECLVVVCLDEKFYKATVRDGGFAAW